MRSQPSICVEIEPALVAWAAGEADPGTGRRVHAHIGDCAPCRRALERYETIEGELATLRRDRVDGGELDAARGRLEERLTDLRHRLVRYRVFRSPFGRILIARSEEGVALIEYLEAGETPSASRLLRLAGVEAVEDGAEVEQVYRDLQAYLAGRTTHLDWPLDLRLARSDFHRRVLATTAAIPYGAVMSYAGLADQVGRPRAVRATAQALRWNPLPIVIPCHRVVGSSGDLTGYAGAGTGRKRRLLDLEGVPLGRTDRDFRVLPQRMYIRFPGETEYCLPSCPSLTPTVHVGCLRFGSRQRAEAAGLAPCTTCRPDLHPISR